jgi:hypothetical protein
MSAEIIDLDPAQARRRDLVNHIRNSESVEMAIRLLFHFEESARYAGVSEGIKQTQEIYGRPAGDEQPPPSAA